MTLMTETAQQITLVEPMPGFPAETEWTLEPIDPRGVLHSLRSVREVALRFVLTPTAWFFPDYDTGFAAATTGALGVDDAGELEVMLVLTVGSSLETATANLRAPVVVARSTGRAVQVVLDDASLSMRRPLVDATG